MIPSHTSCMFDGDTFIGTFSEAGRGASATVTVCYAGQERTAPLGSASASFAAQRLLSELVREHVASDCESAAA